MAEPKFNEKNGVELSPELKSSLDLIQDATLVHVHHNNHNEILSFSQQLNIASPHMPPHHYLVDSEDEIDESDDDDDLDYEFVNDDDYDDSDIDDNDFNEKIKLEVFNRPPSRLGRPLSNPYKRHNKRNGPSVDRIKMDNAFLRNQNSKLSQELEQCRLTIQALKNIVTQKDIALQNSRSDYQKAILQVRVLETLILSKHSKDGSIIVRSGGIGGNNLPTVTSLLQEKEMISLFQEKDLILQEKCLDKPIDSIDSIDSLESDSLENTIITSQIPQTTQPPSLETPSDFIGSSDDDDEDLIPPPLPPKRANRHIRRWSMDFGPNNRLGQDEEGSIQMNMINSNITQATSSDDNTIISSSGTTPSSSTLTPINNDLQRNLPRILRRRTGDIIQSLSSCRSSSTKNGYDHSPPSTPFSDDSNETIINEKSTKKRKSAQQNLSKLRKIFLR
ncbi:uncharacterized protein OCT59_025685 [Rhizophagus irregularis]|uniref:Uncharacterized protein n=3 Tax=Rhizophagus irregularis TaxID=588596 RepID=U9TSW4_RHIID|nr:hypothetical protein GLOIN_2v1493266 [Rhizophagus irregularis DAOM 181602=DAOM 197198]UZO05328.1 hypothetical protein OCT59_025685 [Rhizophagus irregularis]POG82731.1 hypothetical protein GLOIN_2v1493266 [Rhizophagus irregularis DAOM 181602=DAOM 197198]CAB4388794.1 unnamed protein product [Rhizophagus irregularis]CAB4488571.1 unnamed protein product [Rhizophagus irregularis]CAB5308194.1 unnamed protein product [Rhizophagus irregularis]|eukprot:XP_025189597.1 hypothetical protein GLOIN_2v1493266 [Rhizophagus irregularis DAOM 181602=DAOM 197198]